MRGSLETFERKESFVTRHIGPREPDLAEMLEALGLDSLEELLEKAVPASIRSTESPTLPGPLSEKEALERLRDYARQNRPLKSMIGLGYHDCDTPAVILRNVLENPGWYTAYTPYQAEISQGRLEALLNFQTLVLDLTGMELANASLLDEATAAAEAMTFCRRISRSDSQRFLVAEDVLPQTLAILQTRAAPLGIQIETCDPFAGLEGEAFALLLQYPGQDGRLREPSAVIEAAKAKGIMVVMAADPLSLVLLKSPGELGADVVIGSAQRFGVPLGFGGPHAAFFATKDAHKRAMPGRVVGVSLDSIGRPALRLALQSREQHIRREKATSNICTAQVLLAVMAGFYAVYHGPDGLKAIAERVHRLTAILCGGLERLGFRPLHRQFFDTLHIKTGEETEAILARALAAGINLRKVDAQSLGIALDETTRRQEIETLWRVFADGEPGLDITDLDDEIEDAIAPEMRRGDEILSHPTFHLYRSETEMLRYLRRLQEKDIALDRAMIPLGSCTMKLNATTEMMAITWPEFGRMHPFAPLDQAVGYRLLIEELAQWLAELTGFHKVSLQPNAGSQGEYAGLLTIRRYHDSRGEGQRRVCLIPSSAHGTNPASAIMAGLEVVVVQCDDHGNIDLQDLRAKAEAHAETLAALMVTYPSTHGVFEAEIREICEVVHKAGGQVYMDGANLNALLGVALPGELGADVAHMNLHKTFCIPHGGGGPGVGPIGVAKHLAPFLPNHPMVPEAGPAEGIGPISAAPWGSAGILPISWAYIAMMGSAGLTRATQAAILSANYVAKRLSGHYPVLYTGQNGMVAHECIIDVRPLKEEAGITVDDIAKRLIDYGFHAPTMSWPVPGTLMTEPTESESKVELDRFCDAMIAIRKEAERVASGEWSSEDNPLKQAPHTAEALAASDWDHGYSRELAAFPAPGQAADKYWPPVSRIDNAYGDRHLVCSCPPLEAYSEAAE